jgi:class 3 adenylate cyclase
MDPRERTSETERRRATVLFADITGFTSLNERRDPEEAYSIVSGCLKGLDAIARAHRGNVDKYLGDCIMVVFGVPTAVEDAPKAAINAAIEMHNYMLEFNREHDTDEVLDIHTGINSGLVISGDISGPVVREFSIMGDPVNIAARLKDLAPPGQIWVGPETHRYTRGAFEFRAMKPMVLKGKEQAVSVYEVLSRAGQLYRSDSGRAAEVVSELVGRDAELADLRAGVAATCAGQGAVATLIGDGGIGKSRLVAELAASEESQPALWLQGRSLSIGATLSYHPFSDLLRGWAGIADGASDEDALAQLEAGLTDLFGADAADVLGVLASLAGLRPGAAQRAGLESIQGDAMENVILGAISRLLRRLAERGPVVLVLEDLHWADASSSALVVPLLRLAASHRIFFLIALRPEPPDALARIRAAVDTVGPSRCSEIPLQPLDRGAAEQLLDNLFRDGDLPHAAKSLIEERTAGNPFYLHEVVRSLIDEGAVEIRNGSLFATSKIDSVVIPSTVQEVIMARIDRLPLATKNALQIVAIIGRSAYTRIIAAVIGEEGIGASLEALTTSDLLIRRERFDESLYEFTHPLVQEVAYGAVTRQKRAEFHRLVAQAIESEFTESHPSYFGMLAYHFSLGDDAENAERYLLRAGEQAAALAASAEALQMLQEASKLYFELHGEAADPAKQAQLERRIGLAFLGSGRMVEGDAHIDRALRLLGQRVPRTALGRQLRFVASTLAVLGDLYWPPLLRRRRVPTERDREIIQMMYARAEAQVTVDPTRFLFDSMESIRKLNTVDPATVEQAGGQFAGAAGFFAYAGLSFGIGERLLARARSLIDSEDTREMLMFGTMNFVHNFLRGGWDDGHMVDPALIDANISLGELWNVINYLPLDAKRKLHQGRFTQAAEELEQITKIADLYAYDLARQNQFAVTMFLHLERRELGQALAAAEAYYAEFEEELVNLLALGAKAKIEILQDDLEAAERSLHAAEQIVARTAIVPSFQGSAYAVSRFWLDVVQAEAAQARGEQKLARVHLRRAARSGKRALARARKVAWHRPETYRLLGRCAWAAGRQRRALELWRRSVEEAEQLGMQPDLGRCYREVGRQLAARDSDLTFLGLDAEGCFDRANEIFESLELAWDLERAAAARALAAARRSA